MRQTGMRSDSVPATLLDALGAATAAAPSADRGRVSKALPGDHARRVVQLTTQLDLDRDTPYVAAWALVLDAIGRSTAVEFADRTADNPVSVTVPRGERIATWLRSLHRQRHQRSLDAMDAATNSAWFGFSESLPEQSPFALIVATDPQQTRLEASYATAAMDASCAEVLLDLAAVALEMITVSPDATVTAIEPAAEMQPSVAACGWDYNGPRSVTACFAEQVALNRDRPAVVWDKGSLTYEALDQASDALAWRLNDSGATPESIVAIALDRCPQAIVSMLAILKVGAAYMPIDPTFPAERVAFMLRDADCKIIVVGSGAKAQLPTDAVLVDADAAWSASSTALSHVEVKAKALAYLMYTSGSTGAPKGVEIEHQSIVRLVKNANFMRLDGSTAMLHAAPLGFDASTLEIWGPLLNGGRCVVHAEPIPSGVGLAASIRGYGVTSAWLTAALFNAVVDENPRDLQGLHELLTGGEALSLPHIRRALAALPGTQLINGYGPTECTTFSTTYAIPRVIDSAARSVPIGFPVSATSVFVVNARGEPVPRGFVGELCIGGVGLARGYRGRDELTSERFVPLQAASPAGPTVDRVYRTGDLARFLPSGALEFLGRSDDQMKIRGYRIEVGEIEAALAAHSTVRACAVVPHESPERGLQLVAYVVPAASGSLDVPAVKEFMAQRLPAFMVPPIFISLASLPVTANGKVDRRALPLPSAQRPELAVSYQAPHDGVEAQIAAVFTRVLGIDRVGRLDNFFQLGGNSLLVLRALARLRDSGYAMLTVADFFSDPTPVGLAQRIAGGRPEVDARRLTRTTDRQGHASIAIIGMAGRLPGAPDIESLWDLLSEGRDAIRHFGDSELDSSISEALRLNSDYVRARGVIDGVELFDSAFFGINPKEAELTDPQQRIFLELAWECLERAGYRAGPEAGPIGVFAGMYNATYFQRHVLRHQELIDRVGEFQVMLANEKDYIATRTAHRLNLTGPAVSVHTACSTSLVAIAQAVDNLRAGRCVMALAGGVSVTCPPASGYLYQDGAMLSPDGHTRTFDADARGTVFSDGAAVVLLKRLDDALADGDHIHAVILGVAINNDGGEKASFTAPSVDGQAAVIANAHDDAKIDARSISYVEAHGTATPLGDPVEVEALTRAFRRHTQDSSFCAIGSIKSNIGHTVIAAGAAGAIKAAMALERGQLPATVNFTALNPKIDFATSPFFVNDRLKAWPRGEQARRAGVSSFGVGGTNAHAVLEEAPLREPSLASIGPQILRLSARTPAALEQAALRLADHLTTHAETNLADAAYTLRVGRVPFAHRLAIVAETPAAAVEALRTRDHPLRTARSLGSGKPEVVFVFPGQGAQYAGMGSALYRDVPEFRAAFDECLAALEGSIATDLKAAVFGSDADALRSTSITQPATFCIEYALARFWIERGLLPSALIGHSVGEFVAAALAGVFSLSDAVRLVAQRGRLMQALPAGSMLSVRLPADQLTTLPAGLSLAADNGPKACVVSGPSAAIEAYRAMLERDGIAASMLQTSHAFHSSMMDAAVAPFESEVRATALHAPQIPIVSTLTGALLTDTDACDPNYWARHLREPVRFSPAVRIASASNEECERVFLEIGPRATLSSLIRQHTSPGRAPPIAIASMPASPADETNALALAVGQLWAIGIDVPWSDAGGARRRIVLPTYPFERQRCWVDAGPAVSVPMISTAPAPVSVPAAAPPVPTPLPVAESADRTPALISRLKNLLEDISGIDFGSADTGMTFVELGLDSLTLTQAALQLKKHFKVEITFRQLMEKHRTLDALGSYLEGELPVESIAAPSQMSTVPAPGTSDGSSAAIAQGGPTAALEQLIRQQMQFMSQQLAALQRTTDVAPAVVAAAPNLQGVTETAASSSELSNKSAGDAGMVKYDAKTAFGAIARIHTTRVGELTERQRSRLDIFMRRYIARTKKSREYTVAHRSHLADPRVVNGFRPQLKEIIYQIVIERSHGSHMFDVDGNEYVDVLSGFGMSLFGWQPPFVTKAIRDQMDSGYDIGPQHPLAGEVAKMVCEFTGFDRAGLCNTGSEAVMGAVRIARTVTGRSKIAIFANSYHGIFDEVIVRATKKLKAYPAAPGIMPNTAENVLVLDYGTDEALEIIKAHADELAAVLVEPVQSRRPDFQPREFLRDLREVTQQSGSVLIFDEVVTGFRCHPGGIQALWGIRADLATYGKVLGGGFPIGVIAGKRDYMDALDGGGWQFGDDSVPTVGVTYFAGTFVRHPLALAAAKASLEYLQREGPELQAGLSLRTAAMADELNAFCRAAGAPMVIKHFSSIWKIFFNEEHPLQDLLFAMMRNRGVHILDNFPCFMTTAHTDNDIAIIKMAFKESVAELQEADFIPRRADGAKFVLDAARPPVPGARLGRDTDGKPAWFIPHPKTPGKYVKVG